MVFPCFLKSAYFTAGFKSEEYKAATDVRPIELSEVVRSKDQQCGRKEKYLINEIENNGIALTTIHKLASWQNQ